MFADFSALTAQQWTVILGVVAVCFGLSAFCILDVWKRQFESSNEKALWMQMCIFIPILGALAYLFVGRKRGS
ncbi:PLD nuclease N-terminal domain-containing protein [Pseudodesulfovibrio tunisiensis]|uniref:PLD nuclease N-terminal domain-containing protein n=1 Tax=Pseudodesulfovibrio tunisiensis TaxID=463192 RepID=UPI001FB542DC|nr:PLD nuclease N-terminal domain-containing protein [Pseudodesulfovibrio tunisiensis]